MKEVGAADRDEVGWPCLGQLSGEFVLLFRRRERAMQRLSKPEDVAEEFSSIHAQVHNQFNQERHIVTWEIFTNTDAGLALAERRRPCGVDRHSKR